MSRQNRFRSLLLVLLLSTALPTFAAISREGGEGRSDWGSSFIRRVAQIVSKFRGVLSNSEMITIPKP